MASAALTVCECSEDSAVKLSEFEEGFGLCSRVDAYLTDTRYILPGVLGSIPVARRAWF